MEIPIKWRFILGIDISKLRLDLCLLDRKTNWMPEKSLPDLDLLPMGRSGSSVKSPDRSSGHGNSEMRRWMHQPARSVAYHHPHYHEYYEQKLAEGKHELVAINNIINKLLRLYCAMWNNQAAYDPEHTQKMIRKYKKSA